MINHFQSAYIEVTSNNNENGFDGPT